MTPKDLSAKDFTKLTDDELAEVKKWSDNDLLRSSTTLDLFPAVEALRRLRVATDRATVAIGFLTFILVVLTGVLVVLGFLGLR
jgi:hypothetical protein